MKEGYIRIWTKKNIEEIQKHLIIVDDLFGMCFNCKEVGLNFVKNRKCTKCNTEFYYITSNNKNEILKILNRIEIEKLSLTFIDRDDWERSIAKKNLDSLFK